MAVRVCDGCKTVANSLEVVQTNWLHGLQLNAGSPAYVITVDPRLSGPRLSGPSIIRIQN